MAYVKGSMSPVIVQILTCTDRNSKACCIIVIATYLQFGLAK